MNDFKLCENGHYYSQSLSECPYCPKKGDFSESFLEKTHLDLDDDLDQTQSFGVGKSVSNLNRTQVYSDDYQSNVNSSLYQFPQTKPRLSRKLAGWLVSFTIDTNGADFKIYEGRNLIGSDSACDVVVPNDPAVSGKHLTILHRMGHFKFRDEFSTNGTFINDIFEEEGSLKDGDLIRIGDTIFKFRSIA